MPLTHVPPPEHMRQELLARLPDFVNQSDPVAGDLYNANEGHQVYLLTSKDLLAGAGLSAVKDAGWRFISTATPGGQGAAAHVSKRSDGTSGMRGISHGPEIAAAVRAANEIASLPQLAGDQHYKLWVLRVPSVLVEAYWLKSPAGNKDWIVPYLATCARIELMKAYPVKEFLDILRTLAQEFRAFDDTADQKGLRPY